MKNSSDVAIQIPSGACSIIQDDNDQLIRDDERSAHSLDLSGSHLCCCPSPGRRQSSQELLVPVSRHCRICLMSNDDLHEDRGLRYSQQEDSGKLILSPCNCKGTFVHENCLKTWLNSRTSEIPSNQCELCLSVFMVERRCRPFRDITCAKTSRSDCVLHSVFLIFVLLVIFGIVATFWCFHSGPIRTQFEVFNTDKKLSFHEILTLIFGTVSFVAFFVALVAQMCVTESFVMLIRRFIRQNQEERFIDRSSELVL